MRSGRKAELCQILLSKDSSSLPQYKPSKEGNKKKKLLDKITSDKPEKWNTELNSSKMK